MGVNAILEKCTNKTGDVKSVRKVTRSQRCFFTGNLVKQNNVAIQYYSRRQREEE